MTPKRLMVQDERYHEFDGFAMRRAKEVEEEFARVKEKDSVMDNIMKRATGLKLEDKVKPFPEPTETSVGGKPPMGSSLDI